MFRSWIRFSLRSLMCVILLIGLLFGLRGYLIQRQERAIADLRKLGAQLQSAQNKSPAAWIWGTTSEVKGVHFLGPDVGDEDVNEIAQSVLQLGGVNRITFAESRISQRGEAQLRSRLERVEIEVWTPILAPPALPTR
jgi:hypothetical protein